MLDLDAQCTDAVSMGMCAGNLPIFLPTIYYSLQAASPVIIYMSGDLRRHKKTTHEGFRYPCHYCDFSASQTQTLKNHISKHHSLL